MSISAFISELITSTVKNDPFFDRCSTPKSRAAHLLGSPRGLFSA